MEGIKSLWSGLPPTLLVDFFPSFSLFYHLYVTWVAVCSESFLIFIHTVDNTLKIPCHDPGLYLGDCS